MNWNLAVTVKILLRTLDLTKNTRLSTSTTFEFHTSYIPRTIFPPWCFPAEKEEKEILVWLVII